jgi:hypothetical protein
LAAALDGVGVRDTGLPLSAINTGALPIGNERQQAGSDGSGRNGPRGDDAWR